jgi:hypothetical protein
MEKEMKNTKQLIIVITLATTTLLRADIGDVVRDVVSVPGRVIQGTGEVVSDIGQAITPETRTGSVGEVIVQAPGTIVEGTGEVLQTTGQAITPGTTRIKEVKTVTVEEPMETVETAENMPTVSTGSCPFEGSEE